MVYGLAYGLVYGLVSPGNSGWHEAANNTDLSLNLYTAMAVEIGRAMEDIIYKLAYGLVSGLAWSVALYMARYMASSRVLTKASWHQVQL